jgi:Flp pilus assembly protein TadD
LLAERLTLQAVNAIDQGDDQRGEQLLIEALTADLYHGPAHNNLGVLYLRQGKLYAAASEFQWATKLIPGHPDPRMNLAMTLERAGQLEEAMREYRSALEVWPGHMPTIQAYARCQVKNGLPQEDLPRLVEQIALRGETDQWRQWAKLQYASNK